MDRYYQDLLAQGTKAGEVKECDSSLPNGTSKESSKDSEYATEKWKGQIEKVIGCMDFEHRSSIFSICRCYLDRHGSFDQVSYWPNFLFLFRICLERFQDILL